VNCLEAMVETCLPCADDLDAESAGLASQYPSTLSVSTTTALSSSMSSLALNSPTERDFETAKNQPSTHGHHQKQRSFKHKSGQSSSKL